MFVTAQIETTPLAWMPGLWPQASLARTFALPARAGTAAASIPSSMRPAWGHVWRCAFARHRPRSAGSWESSPQRGASRILARNPVICSCNLAVGLVACLCWRFLSCGSVFVRHAPRRKGCGQRTAILLTETDIKWPVVP